MSAEAQPLPGASSDETLDANGNPFVSTAGNGGGALGGVAGNANATTAENAAEGILGAAATAQQGAPAPTTLVPSPPQSPVLGFSDKTNNKNRTSRGLFQPSLSDLNAITVANDNGASARVGAPTGVGAPIENGKDPADEATMAFQRYVELAGEDWNATKALNDLVAQRQQVKSDIANCQAEKRACEDDSKKIHQEWKVLKRACEAKGVEAKAKVQETNEVDVRLKALMQLHTTNMDTMGGVRQKANDAAEKFEQAKNAMRSGPQAGASKR